MAPRRELTRYVGARSGRQADTGRGGAASGGQRSLRKGTRRGMSRNVASGGCTFAGLRVARDDRAGQGMG